MANEENEERCPHCGVSLQGEPIPEKDLGYYGGRTHFSRKIGIEERDRDRTVWWLCPDCGWEWLRK